MSTCAGLVAGDAREVPERKIDKGQAVPVFGLERVALNPTQIECNPLLLSRLDRLFTG
jgi:hypothetical protein